MQSLKFLILCVFVVLNFTSISSKNYEIKGKVLDEHGHALIGASVKVVNDAIGSATDRDGYFSFSLIEGIAILEYKFVGYITSYDTLRLNADLEIEKYLMLSNKILNELTVVQNYLPRKIINSLNVDIVDTKFILEENGGSIMQSLSRIPGISSMDIGSGQSKPVIRGLGFNRVVVAENGIKHTGQEWGVDHGLEIDQFAVDRIEIIKGPGSLMFGSDAIGGVVDLKKNLNYSINQTGGKILANHHSNNDLYGLSASFFQRFDKLRYNIQFSKTKYSDYKVPVDSINYMNYNIRLKENRLRNTAGEKNYVGLSLGFMDEYFSSQIIFTNNFEKSGFFANAHGLEIRNSLNEYDASKSDIDLPSQQVNHIKLQSHTNWTVLDYKYNLDLGWQNNHRREFSEPVAHGYMPKPKDSLERLYDKNSYNASFRLELPKHHVNQMTAGIQWEHQNNESGGWGFMIPSFKTTNLGAFLYDHIYFSQLFQINLGLRYDIGHISTKSYFDWYQTPVGLDNIYMQRAYSLDKWYGSMSWAMGLKRTVDKYVYKLNLGKSFRMPTAKELVSNGINYHMFRVEKGDTSLSSEQSYQLDFAVEYQDKKFAFELNPFINYFPNYIYLNPSSRFTDAQQIYYYNQSEVIRAGGEIGLEYSIFTDLDFKGDIEYVYSKQMIGDKIGYSLPFSPPLTSNLELVYKGFKLNSFQNTKLSIRFKLVADQNAIVPPELTTPGYTLINMGAYTETEIWKQSFVVRLNVNNLLNTKYFDHTSFYRLLQVPSPGRNFTFSVEIPIN